MLPGITVTQAAAGRTTLIALVIAVAVGAIVLVPSLALLFTFYLRGRLDAPDTGVTAATVDAQETRVPRRPSAPAGSRPPRATATAAVAGLIAGAGLVVLASPAWAQALGVVCLVLCAVAAFRLANRSFDI
jgi:cytochrome d ubiquinol oxidase subunit II